MGQQSLSVIDRLRIFEARGQAVVLDSDLATIYGVQTGNFNKAVVRNHERFPANFAFVLTKDEFESSIFQIGTSKGRGCIRENRALARSPVGKAENAGSDSTLKPNDSINFP